MYKPALKACVIYAIFGFVNYTIPYDALAQDQPQIITANQALDKQKQIVEILNRHEQFIVTRGEQKLSEDRENRNAPPIGESFTSIPQELLEALNDLESLEQKNPGQIRGSVSLWTRSARLAMRLVAYDDAEKIYQRLLITVNKSVTETTEIQRLNVLMNYGEFLLRTFRIDEALELLREASDRSLALSKAASFSTLAARELLFYKRIYSASLAHQANAMASMGRWESAASLFESSARIPFIGSPQERRRIQFGQARALLHQGGNEKVVELLAREKLSEIQSNDSPEFATWNSILAESLLQQGRLEAAITEAKIVKDSILKASSSSNYIAEDIHSVSSIASYVLSKSYRLSGKKFEALIQANQALDSFNSTRATTGNYAHDDLHRITQEILNLRNPFSLHISQDQNTLTDELFSLLQAQRSRSTSYAITQLSKRFAIGDSALAKTVRERQDLDRQRQAFYFDIAKGTNNSNLPDSASYIPEVNKKITDLDQKLADLFPQFDFLSKNKEVKLKETQGVLFTDECLITWFIGDDGSWLIIVRSDDARIIPLQVKAKHLQKEILAIRKSVELDRGGLSVFPAQKAYDLYSELLLPAEKYLHGVKHVYLVPERRFANLPLSLLLTSRPNQAYINPDDEAAFKNAPWLVNRFSLTTLPSVSSLHALRAIAKTDEQRDPFLGIGDPVLTGSARTSSSTRVLPEISFRSGVADVRQFSMLEPLPETANELKSIARIVAPAGGTLLLGKQAIEKSVKTLPIDRYRIISFATHGLIAGEFSGIREPGLVLTPPETPSPEDDGVLTASEVAQLKMNADWVILSACNTGEGDGGLANESLSGLAKSFFYAGSKNLLVSHWKIPSESTVALTTETVKWSEKPGFTKAESHRQGMLSLINSGEAIKAHPSVWASFSLVGEGR
jgi:CHAT domain-containing protein